MLPCSAEQRFSGLIPTNTQTNKERKWEVWPEWIYSQVLYFEPRAGGEVRIVGFYNNKQTKQTVRKQVRTNESLERMGLPLDLVNQKTKTKLVI